MSVCLLLILSPACLLVCLLPCLAVFNLIKNGSPILIRLANGAEFAGRLPNLHIKSINCYYCCCSRDSRLEAGNTKHSVDRQSNLAGCCCCFCFCSGPTPIAPELCLISKVVKQTNSSGTKCSDRERESESEREGEKSGRLLGYLSRWEKARDHNDERAKTTRLPRRRVKSAPDPDPVPDPYQSKSHPIRPTQTAQKITIKIYKKN